MKNPIDWSITLHQNDIPPRCYQTCGNFKLLRWVGLTEMEGCCTEGHTPNNPACKFWESDGHSIDPLTRDGNQLLLFPKDKIL